MATLHLVCGLPGSGKTTLAKSLEQELGAVRLCPDEWIAALGFGLWDEELRGRVEALQWDLGRRLLGLGVSVIVEWGTWVANERLTLLRDADVLGAATELYLLDSPLDVVWERVRLRRMEDPPVTREDVDRWWTLFQRPDEAELALYSRVHP